MVPVPPSPLDDRANSVHAWARYKRLLRVAGIATALVIAGAMALIYAQNGMVSIHLYIASAMGIGVTIMLGAALMGLVFLSSGTGHDEAIVDPLEDERKP